MPAAILGLCASAAPIRADGVTLKTGEHLTGQLMLAESQDILLVSGHGTYRIRLALLQTGAFTITPATPFRLILRSGKLLVVHPRELSAATLLTSEGAFSTDQIHTLYPLPPDEIPDR